MAEDRFLHPALGHSDKVNLLTDLEFRVWIQYLLTADDFGVMRFSAVTVQSASDALSVRSGRMIQRCLERLVDVGLLVDFEHQKRKYLCQLDWAEKQPMRFPRSTTNPPPPLPILSRSKEETVGRVRDHHPAFVDVPFDAHQPYIDDATSTELQVTANSKQLTANGLRERFAEFWRCYPRRVGKNAAWKAWQKVKPDSELLAQMLAVLAWQKQQDDWLEAGGKFVPHPSSWLNQGRWQDEPSDAPRIANRTIALVRAGEEFLKS